jgi:hypothetical protein
MVPTLRWRQSAPDVLKPFLNAFPIPNTPEKLVAPSRFPPNQPETTPSGFAFYNDTYSDPSSMDSYSVRLDHSVNSKLTLFGRYSDSPSNAMLRSMNTLTGTTANTRTLTLGAMSTITPVLNNELRFNYSRNMGLQSKTMDSYGGAVPVTLEQLVSGYSGTGVKQGTISFNTYQGGGAAQLSLGDAVKSYQRQINLVDNLSWAKGKHQLKFGFCFRATNRGGLPVELHERQRNRVARWFRRLL